MTNVAVRVTADLSQLTMLRALSDTVALIADFAIDEVTDIRLALDEVATWLIRDAAPGASVDCRFAYDERCLIACVSSVTRSEEALTQTNLRWQIVRSMTDALYGAQEPYDGALSGYLTVIEFCWMRGIYAHAIPSP